MEEENKVETPIEESSAVDCENCEEVAPVEEVAEVANEVE